MTKKDYEAIAQIINNCHVGDEWNTPTINVNRLVTRLASLFADDNPRFDRAMFLRSCGSEDGGQ